MTCQEYGHFITQAYIESKGKDSFRGADGVILFPLSIGCRSSLHPFRSAPKAGMKSVHAGNHYLSTSAPDRPQILEQVLLHNHNPGPYQVPARRYRRECSEWSKRGGSSRINVKQYPSGDLLFPHAKPQTRKGNRESLRAFASLRETFLPISRKSAMIRRGKG
jgi:hypothetical protein